MQKKNTPDSKDSSEKKSSSSKLAKFTTIAGIIASTIFCNNVGYSQNQKTPDNLKKKTTSELVINMSDSLDHQKIITMDVDTLLAEYGQEKGMEIIREHILIEINKIRSDAGKTNLTLHDTLNNLCDYYAKYMSDNNRYEHKDKFGLTANDRMEKRGIKFPPKNIVKGAENIAKNCYTIKNVLEGRMGSAGHRKNILFVDFSHMGLGYDKGYRAQDFF